jgi:hypothetical protein
VLGILSGHDRIKLLFLATSSAGATRTTRTAKLKELNHDHRIEDAGLALAAVRECGQQVGFNRALWEALTVNVQTREIEVNRSTRVTPKALNQKKKRA